MDDICLYLSVFVPDTPTLSIRHPWNVSFHFSFLILDSQYDPLEGDQPVARPLPTEDNTTTE
jgi:hypothetical protein